MKRTVAFALTIVLLCFSLTSCIIIPLKTNFEIDPSAVAFVEVYYLAEVDTLYGNFVKTEETAYKIPTEQTADFLGDLAKIEFSDAIVIVLAAIDPSFYYDDRTVRINYNDGSFELISPDGYGQTFSNTGELIDSHHYGCNQDEWDALISKYVPSDVIPSPIPAE